MLQKSSADLRDPRIGFRQAKFRFNPLKYIFINELTAEENMCNVPRFINPNMWPCSEPKYASFISNYYRRPHKLVVVVEEAAHSVSQFKKLLMYFSFNFQLQLISLGFQVKAVDVTHTFTLM